MVKRFYSLFNTSEGAFAVTLLQIRYAIVCAKSKSVTKAAALLLTTPSNVSKTIKSLEDELSYAIFERTNQGMLPTANGNVFLRHAASILDDYEKMLHLSTDQEQTQLSVCCNQVPFCSDAFLHQITAWQNAESMTFKMLRGNYSFCLNKLQRFKCQFAILGFLDGAQHSYLDTCTSAGMNCKKIGSAAAALLLRRKHPLLQNMHASSADALLKLPGLYQHPYINYSLDEYQDDILTPFQIGSDFWPVNPNKIITVNSFEQKLNILRSTNGFSFGVSTADQIVESSDGICLIPHCDVRFSYYCIFPAKESLSPVAQAFLEEMKKQLQPEI